MSYIGADRAWPLAAGSGPTITLIALLWLGAASLVKRYPNLVTRLLFGTITALALLILYFFRDPNRPLSTDSDVVVSPGDGEVVAIEHRETTPYAAEEMNRISIFLSILDVHVQRAPLAGQVALVDYRPGEYLQAFRPEASQRNEFIAMRLDTAHGPLIVKQIAGIMARRCVNYRRPGDTLQAGERFGLIRFGSRVDLFLPEDAVITTAIGEKVKGGLTPIAHFATGGRIAQQ